jgi:hypothetical protein
VLVSETVRINMVGTGIKFKDHGEHRLKGVPGTWRLFSRTLFGIWAGVSVGGRSARTRLRRLAGGLP